MNEPISRNLFVVCLTFILVISTVIFCVILSLKNLKKIIRKIKNFRKNGDTYDYIVDNLSFKLSSRYLCKTSHKFLELILQFYSSIVLLINSVLSIKEIITTKTVPYSFHVNIILIFYIFVFSPTFLIFVIKKFNIYIKSKKR